MRCSQYRDAVAELSTQTEKVAALETELQTLRSGLDEKIAEINERTTELEKLKESLENSSEAQRGLDEEVKRLRGIADSLEAEHKKTFNKAESDVSVPYDLFKGLLSHSLLL